MKAKIILILLFLAACSNEPNIKYKKVLSITHESKTYPVTITEYTNNGISRTAGGALVGGALGYVFGFGVGKSAIAGGLVGAATTNGETSRSYTKMQTDILYTVTFSDSTKDFSINFCYYHLGDSVAIY